MATLSSTRLAPRLKRLSPTLTHSFADCPCLLFSLSSSYTTRLLNASPMDSTSRLKSKFPATRMKNKKLESQAPCSRSLIHSALLPCFICARSLESRPNWCRGRTFVGQAEQRADDSISGPSGSSHNLLIATRILARLHVNPPPPWQARAGSTNSRAVAALSRELSSPLCAV